MNTAEVEHEKRCAEWVKRQVEKAPPLTPSQRARISRLVNGGEPR